MELDFCNEGPSQYEIYEEKYNALFDKTIKFLKLKGDYYMSVTIVDNEKIHEINRDYRGVDRPTDVISFALLDNEANKPVKGMPTDLGEIIISFEKAEEQAKEYGHSSEREFSFLFVHGLLHLLGYDHMEKEDEVVMFKLQDDILGAR
ncbi:MAG: rRNA maturation RNase YbeY [Bacilli bacterium]|nr:rRNA maturation RNase YbeY [Bacilli bacterium]